MKFNVRVVFSHSFFSEGTELVFSKKNLKSGIFLFFKPKEKYINEYIINTFKYIEAG